MLNIVEVIPILSIRRGAESFFANLSCALKKREDVKLDVVILYDEIDKSFVDQFDKEGIKPIFCHKRKGIDFKASHVFKNVIKKLNPDIIHTHNCCFFTYFLAFGFRKKKWKYFHTCHSVPEVEATNLEHLVRSFYSRRKLITNIGISPIVSRGFEERYKIGKVPYVLNGIPLNNDSAVVEKKYDFIICASIDENKNHRLLIESFKSLKNYKSLNLICLGGGPLLDECRKLVKDNDLEKNIMFLGPVSDVGLYLEQSKVFVLPSKNEGFPISILEAMNYGLPIIASKVGGIPDFVSDKNGILFDPNKSDQLVDAMDKVISDNEFYSRISLYNKEYVKNFSIDKVAEDYLNIFKGNL